MHDFALRRLFAAPDNAHELIATCNRGCVPYGRYNSGERRIDFGPLPPRGEDRDAAASAEEEEEEQGYESKTAMLPFPATDLSWCPAKAGTENSSFLSACNSQPLQLWDSEDGALRASYVAANSSGNHTHPRCCGWLPMPSGQLLAMGGYGGHEDPFPVRFFDVLYEGSNVVYAYDSTYHAGALSSNNLVAALCCGPRGTQGLALAGYRNHLTVDVIDVRHRCPAAVLAGGGSLAQHGSVRALKTHPTREGLIFASGARSAQRRGRESILCWDLRRPSEPLVALDRGPVSTQQVCDFAFVAGQRGAAAAEGAKDLLLVSTSSSGGLYAFDLSSALLSTSTLETKPLLADELGATSGIASLETLDSAGRVMSAGAAGTVAVVVGSRTHTFDAAATSGANKRARKERVAAAEDSDDDDDDRECHLQTLQRGRKHALAPMEEDDDDGDVGGRTATAARKLSAASGPNAMVVTLPQSLFS